MKGGIKYGTDCCYDNSLRQQYILRADPSFGTFKVRRCKDLLGQISMETETQWAVCGGVVGGGLSWNHVEDRPGSLQEEGCVNKFYLSAVSSGLSELSQLRQGARSFNWHISYLVASEHLTYRHRVHTLQNSLCELPCWWQWEANEMQDVHSRGRFCKAFQFRSLKFLQTVKSAGRAALCCPGTCTSTTR